MIPVGDPHQAIYRSVGALPWLAPAKPFDRRWRGGLNTWHTLPADRTFRLSKSYRFGSQLANVANTLTAYQNEEESVKGNSAPGVVYRPLKSLEFYGERSGRCCSARTEVRFRSSAIVRP